ncbi:hypothetical protein [Hyphomicrobium sp. DY-1]|uniref:hypothetical protein n=1 Tax=Hyphomicrobium sp. DY-1 TaxID=3075650 RepID=UPI0039C0CA5D
MDDILRACDDLAFVRIDGDDLQRWAATARRLEPVTDVVTATVTNLHVNRCQGSLAQCANAARFAAEIASEPERTITVALAEDFERHVMQGH